MTYISLSRLVHSLISLTVLDVNENKLSHIPESIGNLTSLTYLRVSNNPIASTQAGKDEVMRRFGRAELDID